MAAPLRAISRPAASPAELASRVGAKGSPTRWGWVAGEPVSLDGGARLHRAVGDRAQARSHRQMAAGLRQPCGSALARDTPRPAQLCCRSALARDIFRESATGSCRSRRKLSATGWPPTGRRRGEAFRQSTSARSRALGAHPRGEFRRRGSRAGNSPAGGTHMDVRSFSTRQGRLVEKPRPAAGSRP